MTNKLAEAIELFDLYKFEDAKLAFEEIIERDNLNNEAKLYLGKIYMKYSEHGKALSVFNQVVENDPNNNEAITNIELVKSILQLTNNYYYENPYTDDDLYEF